ncbi:MFS transporter [Pseudomonas oryzihabitans]|nr:MFS transporter [Pseudomonas psychrotolerans]
MPTRPLVTAPVSTPGVSSRLTLVFALAAGILVLALYAAQPLVGVLGPELGLPPRWAGLVSTATLLGYATGLLLLVPLTDLFENRRLILTTLSANALALLLLAVAPSAAVFLVTAFAVGLSMSVIQMLVPVVAGLSEAANRGRTVGTVMSGLMLGVLLSRPLASLLTQWLSWRCLYALLGLLVGGLIPLLARNVHPLHPPAGISYGRLLLSLGRLLREEPVLRARAASQALGMGAFSVFWTAITLRLTEPPLALGPNGIALFALAGVAGAIVAPLAGRAGDRGLTRPATLLAHATILVALLLAYWGGVSFAANRTLSLTLLLLAAVALDLGVIADQALGRRAINLLRPEARGRLNGLFTGLFFLGSALGAALSGLAWQVAGWSGACWVGLVFAIAGLASALSAGRA